MTLPTIPTDCDELATEIIIEHEKAQAAAQSAVEHAQSAGVLLLEAKAAVPHGEWGAWVRDRLPFSERTAQSYMRVARIFPTLDEAKAQRVADLPLRKALAELAEPRKSGDPIEEPLPPTTTKCAMSERQKYAEQIRKIWRDGVRNTIEAGHDLINAKKEMPRAEFNGWVREERLGRPRRVSQHMAVSRNPLLTDPTYWSSLPIDLEVLFELSCLPHELLETALEDGEIRPDMSKRDVLWLRPEVQKDVAALKQSARQKERSA